MNEHDPTTDPPRDELDDLLQQWKSASAGSPTSEAMHLQQLQSRIVAAVQDSSDAPQIVTTRTAVWPLLVLAAVAATVVAVATLTTMRMKGTGHRSDELALDKQSPPDAAFLSTVELSRRRSVLAEAEQLFANDFAWVAETDDEVQLGIEPNPSSATPTPVVAVRLIVMKRAPNEKRWSSVWSADVIAREQQLVIFKPRRREDAQIVLWTYLLPDGMIQIDSQLTLGAGSSFDIAASQLQRPGVPSDVHATNKIGTEYRVFQTALPMDRSSTPDTPTFPG